MKSWNRLVVLCAAGLGLPLAAVAAELPKVDLARAAEISGGRCALCHGAEGDSSSPLLTEGSVLSSSPLRSAGITFVQPSKRRMRPRAFRRKSPAPTVSVVESYFAGVIWQATNWRQIS